MTCTHPAGLELLQGDAFARGLAPGVIHPSIAARQSKGRAVSAPCCLPARPLACKVCELTCPLRRAPLAHTSARYPCHGCHAYRTIMDILALRDVHRLPQVRTCFSYTGCTFPIQTRGSSSQSLPSLLVLAQTRASAEGSKRPTG